MSQPARRRRRPRTSVTKVERARAKNTVVTCLFKYVAHNTPTHTFACHGANAIAIMMQSRVLRVVGGGVVYIGGVAAAYEYSRPIPKLPSSCERCAKFNELAPNYDGEIAQDEKTSGILDLRRELAAHASGKTLEIAGGTGRNLEFYDGDRVTSLLIGDYSESMLHVAAHKVAHMRQKECSSSLASRVTLAVLDACALALPSASYDTVVDTFGLCSFEKPEVALRELARCVKPGGSVLLLEHGASDWTLLAWWQQHRLNRHVVRWGCYWNRDILGLVEGEKGLKVKSVQRKHLGTTYLIVCEKQ